MTGAAADGGADDGPVLAAVDGAVLLGAALGVGVADVEQAASPIATVAKSARDLRAPA
ncbi:MAG TPA: hypothetical protein VF323_08780 [Candidatus Limnocylindrales bacterium]